MAETEPTGTGSLVENPGILVDHIPRAPWEYRVLSCGNATFLDLYCEWNQCKKVLRCRAVDARGDNTLGTTICPHCNKKAYVRINKIWFECS